jgi:hypothetical protein
MRTRVAAAALSVALVAALAFGAIQVARLRTDAEQRHQRAEVIRAVRAQVIALTDISASTTDAQIKELLAGMTKHLRGEFAPQADAFRQAMVTSKVRSRGRVIAVGVTTIGARRATAVVAAGARVANARTAGDQERSYRLGLTLRKIQGRWLVDSIEFVP